MKERTENAVMQSVLKKYRGDKGCWGLFVNQYIYTPNFELMKKD
jgi:hypothetical protein